MQGKSTVLAILHNSINCNIVSIVLLLEEQVRYSCFSVQNFNSNSKTIGKASHGSRILWPSYSMTKEPQAPPSCMGSIVDPQKTSKFCDVCDFANVKPFVFLTSMCIVRIYYKGVNVRITLM